MVKIGITKSETAFQNYPTWILKDAQDVELIILSYEEDYQVALDQCDGIMLSGGVDIHPRMYGASRTDYPYAPVFDERRDEFELNILLKSFERGLPILGVCRGMQLINVAFGGTLSYDLEEWGKDNHRRGQEGDGLHSIAVDTTSQFFGITGLDYGLVNSAHHQGIKDLSNELNIVAWSDDHVAEAVELTDNSKSPFFTAVQWHPERFTHDLYAESFSLNIKKSFLNSCRKNKQ